MILEIEVGVVGGEEDGVAQEINDKLYTSPEDFLATLDALGMPENNSYIVAATFGNVHGVYKPGGVQLRPAVLKEGQDALCTRLGLPAGSKPFSLVFHGGSGSSARGDRRGGLLRRHQDEHRHRHPVRVHPARRRTTSSSNYDGVLKVDGEVGNKKAYDPRDVQQDRPRSAWPRASWRRASSWVRRASRSRA